MASVLQIEGLSKYIGDLVLFEDVTIHLNKGDKAALIGINGAGKTSLLNLIAGHDSPDAGKITTASDVRVSYLPQEPQFPANLSIFEILFQSDNENIKTIKEYESAILTHDVKAIDIAVSKMDQHKLWAYESDIKSMLTQLEITDFTQKAGELSGGQQKRLAIAEVLLNEPELLILDEPTNHLDLSVIEWLESYLLRKDVSLLIVTHDRYFLDRICNTIFEIDQKRIYRYDGNYSKFVEQRQKRIELEQLEVEKAQNLLRKEEDWMSRMPKARGTKAKYRIDNYYNLKDVASKRRDDKTIKVNIRESRMGTKILEATNVYFKWDNQYYIKDFNYKFSRYEKIGVIGSNGSGKSTFLELLTGNIIPESGTIVTGETIKIGYYRQAGMAFDENMKVLDAITNIAETIAVADGTIITASQFLNYFLFPYPRQYDYIYKLSGGERRRLYLCSILMQNPNFLILDEPTNDLDITTLQVLEEYLADFSGCVLVVSHDRFFIDNVVDHLFVFQGNTTIKDFPGNYTEYYNWKKIQEKSVIEQKPAEKKEKPVSQKSKNKLTFAEKKELEKLEIEIALLENEKMTIENQLNSGTLKPDELMEKSLRIGIIIKDLDEKSDRWLELSERE